MVFQRLRRVDRNRVAHRVQQRQIFQCIGVKPGILQVDFVLLTPRVGGIELTLGPAGLAFYYTGELTCADFQFGTQDCFDAQCLRDRFYLVTGSGRDNNEVMPQLTVCVYQFLRFRIELLLQVFVKQAIADTDKFLLTDSL